MIRFEQQVLPFSKPSECGDFACLLETEEGDLVVVGDVGGHGSPRVGGLAQEALAVIESNKNESLTRIYEAVSNIPGLRQFGAVLFAARFSRRMPVFHYLSLGNIRAFLVREGQVRKLAHDEGIIGLQAPPNIHMRLLKLANADQVVITTDGVASIENHLSALATEQGGIAQSIIDRFAYKEDDALCAVVQYRLTDSQLSRQPIQTPDLNAAAAPAKETLADKVIASRLGREGTTAPVPAELNERLTPLSEAHLLGGGYVIHRYGGQSPQYIAAAWLLLSSSSQDFRPCAGAASSQCGLGKVVCVERSTAVPDSGSRSGRRKGRISV